MTQLRPNARVLLALTALAALFTAACGSPPPPKPLPGGLPPEYEAPRAYKGNLGDEPAPPPALPIEEPPPAAAPAPPGDAAPPSGPSDAPATAPTSVTSPTPPKPPK